MSVDIHPRHLAIILIGTGDGALTLRADALTEIAIQQTRDRLDIHVHF
ncbi:hypothetical protein ACIO1C_31265 [Streptomyces sp. NPDC087420]